METEKTAQILRRWCESLAKDDVEAVINGLSETVVFHAPQNEYNKIIPYLGKKVGRKAVVEAFESRAKTTELLEYELLDIIVHDNKACIVSRTKEICKHTQKVFEIEDAQYIILEDGKIASWSFYFDPNTEVAAFKADIDNQLIQAVQDNQLDAVQSLLDVGANVNTRDACTGLTVLMMAASQANAEIVKILLDAGADVFTLDSRFGTSVLHQACLGGSVEVVQLLVEAGAFVDAVTSTPGHTTPLHDALWRGYAECAEILINAAASLNLKDQDGKTPLAIATEVFGSEHILVKRLQLNLESATI